MFHNAHMSLASRIILLILAVVTTMVLSGAVVVVKNARQNVAKEIDTSAELTMQLLSAVFYSSQTRASSEPMDILVDHLQQIEHIRHLNLSIQQADYSSPKKVLIANPERKSQAPWWFASLVSPGLREYHRQFSSNTRTPVEITITPDPREEIDQVWNDTLTVFGLIMFFTIISIILTALLIRRALKPVNQISSGLDIIQDGDYKARLPEFNLPELNQLSLKFNHMASVLDRQQSENRELSKRMLSMLEANQRHMAQELHDELGQSITAIKARAASLMHASPVNTEGAQTIVDICNHMYGVVRSMMNRLRPVVLDELGLVTAVERLVDDWNSIHENTFAALTINGKFDNIGDDISIHIYRIVQEALTNIAKHSRAGNVTILLQNSTDGRITLHIEDDGQGFDRQTRPLGMGLTGMQNRADSCNGNLSLVGIPGRGVKIDLVIPAATNQAKTTS